MKVILILVIAILILIYILYKSTRSKENFSPVVKSFGTFLKSTNANTYQSSLLFRSIKPTKTRPMPSFYPDPSKLDDYKSYLSDIGTQGICGSCWAWASVGVLSDRYSLLSDKKIKVNLSPEKVISCTFNFDLLKDKDLNLLWSNRKTESQKIIKDSNLGCSGNDLYSAARELFIFGTTSMKCTPYTLTKSMDAPKCSDLLGEDFDLCVDGTAARIFSADDIYSLEKNEEYIMLEIFRYGPVSAGMLVFKNFLHDYDGKTIYTGPVNKKESPAGGHAVRIVGWGEENGVKYWIIANSWGIEWGMNGYFRMQRMMPECQLEDNVVTMKPRIQNTKYTQTLDAVKPIDLVLKKFSQHELDPKTMLYFSADKKVNQKGIKALEGNVSTPDNDYTDESEFWLGDKFI